MSVNIAIISGFLGHDPSTRYAETGTAVTRFSVATDDWAGKSGQKTNWHQVQCFGKTAEIAKEYLRKGSHVTVQGRIDYQEWVSKEGEQKRATVIIADRVDFSGNQRKAAGGTGREAPRAETQAHQEQEPRRGTEDDIPF